MKHPVIAMKKHGGGVTITEYDGKQSRLKMKLPSGCTGILFVFDSKKAAREYWGNDIELLRCEWSKGAWSWKNIEKELRCENGKDAMTTSGKG